MSPTGRAEPWRTTSFTRIAGLLLALSAAGACAGYGPPDTAQAQLQFGVTMARQELWNEALFRFQQADRLQPGNPRILNDLAVAYEALGRFDQALDRYQAALKADPANAEIRRNYSRFVEFYQSFRPDAARQAPGTGAGAEATSEEEEPAAEPPAPGPPPVPEPIPEPVPTSPHPPDEPPAGPGSRGGP